MEIELSTIILLVGLFFFMLKRSLRYLRYLQQEDYNVLRFFSWIASNRAVDTRGFLVSLISFIAIVMIGYEYLVPCLQGLLFVFLAFYEPDPRCLGKKKLVMTKRSQAIFLLAVGLTAILSVAIFPNLLELGALAKTCTLIFLTQSPPLLLAASVLILSPKERSLQKKYLNEAHEKFIKIDPFTVGITGSFGKSSVKNLLGEMMSLCVGSTFWPSEGVNTPMGITRQIRERLKDQHKYAVIEMGAYKEGSIKRLCDLTPVDAGIVTAVHLVHLERFGSEEQVYKAKSELAQAVPQDGILIVNGDNPGARRMAMEYPKATTLLYGLDPSLGKLDVFISEIKSERTGTSFSLEHSGNKYSGHTKMHGKSALSNICACFSLLVTKGVSPELILASLREIKPVSNRLEVKDYRSYIQINDAYNSNPVGFRSALEVLNDLPGARKVLITPGMIELGDKLYHENNEIAKYAGTICDLIIIVNEVNKQAYFDGLAEIKYPQDQIKWFMTRDEALGFYKTIQAEGDVLLLENDLPDLQEFKEIF